MSYFSRKKIEKGVLFLIPFLFSANAFAASFGDFFRDAFGSNPPQNGAGEGTGNEVESLRLIAEIIDSVLGRSAIDMFVSAAMPIASNLNGLAMSIAGALALIALLWALLIAIISKKSAFSAMMEPVIFSALTAMLLANYAMIVGDVVNLGQRAIAASGTSVGSAFTGFINTFLGSFINIFISVLDRFEFTWGFFSIVLEAVIALVILAGAGVLILIAIKDIVAVFLTGPVALGIGVAVGPLFIATLPMPATRRWFDQWINFLINAAMLTALAVIVMVLIQNAILNTVQGFMTGETGTVGKLVAIAMIAASLSKVFQAIPSFADALFPGRTGAGSAMSSSPGNMIANVAQGAVRGASNVANGAYKAAAGMQKAGQQTGAALARKAGRQSSTP